jgi:hypothetical protein
LQEKDICNAIFSIEDPRKKKITKNRYPSFIDVLRSQSELLLSPVIKNITSCEDICKTK